MATGIDSLKEFIRNAIPIPLAIAEEISSHFKSIDLPKGDFLLKAGRLADSYMFLEQGFLRAYTLDQEGNEVTTAFYNDNTVVFEVYSFFNRTLSKENIQALTGSTGWVISYDTLNHLFHTIPAFRDFGRAMLVKGFSAFKQRMLSMINETAEQRYATLLNTSPHIFQFAPLKDIASFLGITDSSLSRIRKQFSAK